MTMEKIKIGLIALAISAVLISGNAEAKCMMFPNLIGELQKTDQEIVVSHQYSCNVFNEVGNQKYSPQLDIPSKYINLVAENKLVCDFEHLWNKTYPDDNWHAGIHPNIVKNGDIVFSTGGCGMPNPGETLVYDKDTNKIKYAHVKHEAWYSGREERITPKNLGGITIIPHKKNKINCEDPRGTCVYSAEFEINGKKIVLEPNQGFKGENFTLRYLGSMFAENVWIEDFSDHFDYEIYFGDTQTESAESEMGPTEEHQLPVADDKTDYFFYGIVGILIVGIILFLWRSKKNK